MIDAILAKIFGTKDEREIKAMQPIVDLCRFGRLSIPHRESRGNAQGRLPPFPRLPIR